MDDDRDDIQTDRAIGICTFHNCINTPLISYTVPRKYLCHRLAGVVVDTFRLPNLTHQFGELFWSQAVEHATNRYVGLSFLIDARHYYMPILRRLTTMHIPDD